MLLNQKTEHYLKNIGLIKLKMNQRFKDLQQEPYIILDELNMYKKNRCHNVHKFINCLCQNFQFYLLLLIIILLLDHQVI